MEEKMPNINTGNHSCTHGHHHYAHEHKVKIVVVICVVAMITEIIFGYTTNSMALLSDGWHMASHVLAIGLTWFAYSFSRKNWNNTKYKNGTEKILSLSGYTSAIILLVIAVLMAGESINRIISPEAIKYSQALIVATIGLAINLICAKILHHEHEDHNIKAAYLHVLADALTSLFAIAALFIGKLYNVSWLDAVSGILGAAVIAKWSYGLIMQSAKKLLDYSNE